MNSIPQQNRNKFFVLCGISLLVITVSPFLGLEFLTFDLLLANPHHRYIFIKLRLPRLVMAFLAGGGFSLCGLVFQALFRNPLASPFTLGISSGAAFGAGVSIILGIGGSFLGMSVTSLTAFTGALIAMILVYIFSQIKKESIIALLLAGVVIERIFSSLLMIIHYLSPLHSSFKIMRWLMGSVDGVSVNALIILTPIYFISLLIIIFMTSELDQVVTGEDIALTRGVNMKQTKAILILATSLMTGSIVAISGPVGFIGIIAPHVCRHIFSIRHNLLAWASFLTGGTFLVICDTLARTVAAPTEVPIGIITALFGGPFFLWILFRKKYDNYF
ncbi:MAG: iron ABC transporter permease [Chitinispirillia bacterium]|jgi:iron complex transport system permease protein